MEEELKKQIHDYLDSLSLFNHVHNGVDYPIVDKDANGITSGGGSPGGSTNDVQYNSGGSFAGSSNLQWNGSDTLTIGNDGTIQAPTGYSLTIRNGLDGGVLQIVGRGASGTGNGTEVDIFSGQGSGVGNRSGDIFVFPSIGASGATSARFVISIGNSANYASYRRILQVATTNATPTSIYGVTIPSDEAIMFEAKVTARRTGGTSGASGDSASYIRRALYKNIAGTVTLVGSIQDNFTVEDQAGWDCTFAISGTEIDLQVTGAANNNINWVAELLFIPASANAPY